MKHPGESLGAFFMSARSASGRHGVGCGTPSVPAVPCATHPPPWTTDNLGLDRALLAGYMALYPSTPVLLEREQPGDRRAAFPVLLLTGDVSIDGVTRCPAWTSCGIASDVIHHLSVLRGRNETYIRPNTV